MIGWQCGIIWNDDIEKKNKYLILFLIVPQSYLSIGYVSAYTYVHPQFIYGTLVY